MFWSHEHQNECNKPAIGERVPFDPTYPISKYSVNIFRTLLSDPEHQTIFFFYLHFAMSARLLGILLDDCGSQIEELAPTADTRVETVAVREESVALDAKTEIEIEIREKEKLENEEVERVEPMEFQMVGCNTEVSIVSTADVIDYKENVAEEVTIEEISTSKTKMEFGNPIPTRSTVWLKNEKSGAGNVNQTYATLHYLLNPRMVKKINNIQRRHPDVES
ncbi:Hypothetical predicted protein [Olea europaea subsp. europaea]|uniref:Uncharacterized protein n=1 Tax=Olea europaea subsp. europaea TaxID=158383 RepID=A0A8S0RFL9_OLEEU|nr:Hypothetical predicted protein [Olea europaea subsp. europaea]